MSKKKSFEEATDSKLKQFKMIMKTRGIDEAYKHFTKSQLVNMVIRAMSTAEQLAHFVKSNTTVTCVYCGHEYGPDTPASQHDALDEHIKVCEKHPLTAALKENAILQEQV